MTRGDRVCLKYDKQQTGTIIRVHDPFGRPSYIVKMDDPAHGIELADREFETMSCLWLPAHNWEELYGSN
jgi:hypothetical protein